jgi:DNA-binding transcriptional ArsR family regulator
MTQDEIKRVTDTATLKAIAHPLRARLLGALRMDGPATASELARKFGESSGSTSYHLRVLATFGFIEEDPQQPNARDRLWRALHSSTYWNDRDFDDDPAGAEAARFLRQGQLGLLLQAGERWESQRDQWSEEWAAAFGPEDYQYRLTAASLTELQARFKALLDEYGKHDEGSEDAEAVVLFLAAYPREGGES